MKQSKSGFIYILITILFFSTLEAVSKSIYDYITPLQLNFLRFLFGGIILFIILLIKKNIRISSKEFLYLWGMGILNVAISMNLLQLALKAPGSGAAIVAVIVSSNPIFVSVFSVIFEKERLDAFKIFGLLTGLAGVFVVFSDKITVGKMTGPLLALLSSVTYGLYTVLGRKISAKTGSLKMNAYSFLAGSITMIPFMLIAGEPVFTFSTKALPQIVYLSVFVTGIAYLCYFIGLEKQGTVKGSLVFFLKPVFASIIAAVFLNEELKINHFTGTGLILAGIFIVLFGRSLIDKLKNNS